MTSDLALGAGEGTPAAVAVGAAFGAVLVLSGSVWTAVVALCALNVAVIGAHARGIEL